jgi:hypothetical protein
MNVYLLADLRSLGGGVWLLLARGGDESTAKHESVSAGAATPQSAKSVAAQQKLNAWFRFCL